MIGDASVTMQLVSSRRQLLLLEYLLQVVLSITVSTFSCTKVNPVVSILFHVVRHVAFPMQLADSSLHWHSMWKKATSQPVIAKVSEPPSLLFISQCPTTTNIPYHSLVRLGWALVRPFCAHVDKPNTQVQTLSGVGQLSASYTYVSEDKQCSQRSGCLWQANW